MDDHSQYIESHQKILDTILSEFTEATGLATILVDTQGTELTAGYGFSPFCQLMRNNEDTRQLCQNCDMFGGRSSLKNNVTTPYICHAGLVDFSYPVTIDNQVIGYILCGQTKIEDKSDFQPIITEKTIWQDDPLFVEAYDNMPSTTPEKIRAGSQLLTIIINYYLSDIMSSHLAIQEPTNIPSQFLKQRHPVKTEEKIPLKHVETISNDTQKITTDRQEIIDALDYINRHLNEVITLDEVSDHVYLSGYYFSKLFKKEVGQNFVDYVNEKKINRSKILLQDSTWSIDSIAHSLGFSQPSYFSKLFKKVTQMSPRDYRQMIQEETRR
ncbi:PocR ligand-binding domain-containing protein [Vagococcus carniphilus]|uniref:PocR ligand-binding domain-containing protein n=1 Tax=Vagococcus carniphilus TaxID=218144 RepID=A0AAW8U842_9ENTE|nr:PocR ligand-binding domain-containing protein [Vagococcus carniphilus]MDT2815561.1 PocR ligand-binding domain-containing protein [Vagococcus carniphilus]MDT2830805.1 PocR ligand-binding domain-containing protein [Vagococcus carniphilus]MDT2834502.1 PocR ligand-binding domain-containing protein [Vagococcus carniphilus]MDT2839423.1 PocR ligand-binding domain-containing protein [Vagococcus carniphilus]MDT2853968.1 PocR ligand-binding domain-containing protein [Vagococcus carniphilus]